MLDKGDLIKMIAVLDGIDVSNIHNATLEQQQAQSFIEYHGREYIVDLLEEVRQLREEVKRLSEKLERRTDESNAFQLKMTHKSAEIRQLTEERDKLVKALEWYADEFNYADVVESDDPEIYQGRQVFADSGERARMTLSEIKGQGDETNE